MGLHICKAFWFWLRLLKIRLGYWLRRNIQTRYEPPSRVVVHTTWTKFAPLAPGLRENLHRFAPAGHLTLTRYCWKCHSLVWAVCATKSKNWQLRYCEAVNFQLRWQIEFTWTIIRFISFVYFCFPSISFTIKCIKISVNKYDADDSLTSWLGREPSAGIQST